VLVPNLAPKPGTARRLPKPCPGNLLNLLTLQRAETGVSKIVKINRQLSTVETRKSTPGLRFLSGSCAREGLDVGCRGRERGSGGRVHVEPHRITEVVGKPRSCQA
jgi:hypothetical protein